MEKPKKILYVITQSEWGGAQRYIFDLATQLPKNRFTAMVAAGGNGPLFEKLKAQEVITFPLRRVVREINPIKDFLGLMELFRLFKSARPDVVHLNSSKAGVLGSIAARLAGVSAIIYTAHGFVFNEPLPAWKRLVYLWAEKLTGRLKSKIICIFEGDHISATANHIAKPESLEVIHNGIGDGKYFDRASARRSLDIRPEKTIVGTIANFYPTKGLPTLIEAARKVTDQIPDVLFAVIGDGTLRTQLERQIRELGLSGSVALLGHKADAEQYIKAFDMYVCPSVKEGLPYSLLEAMNASVPIVATRVGGIPEMIEDGATGRLVPPSDPSALAEVILATLKDRQKAAEMAARGKEVVEQRFQLQKMIEKTTKLY